MVMNPNPHSLIKVLDEKQTQMNRKYLIIDKFLNYNKYNILLNNFILYIVSFLLNYYLLKIFYFCPLSSFIFFIIFNFIIFFLIFFFIFNFILSFFIFFFKITIKFMISFIPFISSN